MGSTRKALKSRYDFVFVDAPHVVDAATQAQLADGVVDNARTWWRWTVRLRERLFHHTTRATQDAQPGTRPSGAMHYEGWETSLCVLTQALEQQAPVHAILGFSQGAAAASLLVAHLQATDSPLLAHLHTAVLVSGFVPHDPRYAAVLHQHPPRVRSLHVMGENDALVPRGRGEQLVGAFSEAEVYVHEGGHMVPTCSGRWKEQLVAFVDRGAVDRGAGGGAGGPWPQ